MRDKRPVRILHIIDTLGLGGAEKILADNLKFIDKDKFENIVVSVYSEKNSDIILELLEGVKVEKIYPGFRHDALSISKSIWGCIKKYKIDIVHTHSPVSDMYGRIIGKLAGCLVLSTAHHSGCYEVIAPVFGVKRTCLKMKLFLIRCLDRLTINLCVDRIIAVSEFVKSYVIKNSGFKPENVKVLYNAIDTDYFNAMDSALVSDKRGELKIHPDEKIILTVGRNVPEKRQEYAIEVIKRLILKKRAIKLIIAGSGPLRSDLEDYSEKLGVRNSVIFLEPEKDIRVLFQMSDVFIFTSMCEGFGIAQIEAMAMARPVVAFRIGPVPEVVKEGISGILVEPKNSKQLAEAVEMILDDTESAGNMGAEGRRIVEEKFNIHRNIKLLEDLYSGIFNAKNG